MRDTLQGFPVIDAARVYKSIVAAAGLAGLLSGLLLTGVQQLHIVPLILAAERYEQQAAQMPGAANEHAASDHASGAPAPGAQLKRTLATALANIVVAMGFALLVASALSWRRASGWRAGVSWGVAGYVVFFVAPAIGLPPLLLGQDAAPLAARELWWFITVVFSAVGCWLALLQRRTVVRLLGVAIIVAPHLVGAPQPAEHMSALPGDLARQFVVASFAANAVLWLALGAATGHFLRARKRRRAPVE